jgi:hypothetical protein
MEKIVIDFENCYGIGSMQAEFDFSQKSANIIYAPNGSMKTSFAKTFQDYSEGSATRDRIHTERITKREIADENGASIPEESIFVIEPYVSSFESARMSTLLANRELKEEYDDILKNIDSKKNDLLKLLREASGLRSNIEDIVSEVFTKRPDNFLRALDRIRNEVEEEVDGALIEIPYTSIFNDKVESFLGTADFKNNIKKYTETYDELVSNSRFFRKGVFNHYQANEIAKQLKNHGFFKADHTVYLNSDKGDRKITSEAELGAVIQEEMNEILSDDKLKKSFEDIDDKIKANQDLRAFREFLLANQSVIPQLANLDLFQENLWKAYMNKHRDSFGLLMDEYDTGKKRIEDITKQASKEATKWQEVINIFNRRFSVPFIVSIENKQDVILKSVTPNISFEFNDDPDSPVPVERGTLLEILSGGEKRALYILNIIFEVEARKEDKIPTVFVIDDIADSFDYKNKYAIVEYLNDILHEGEFKQIILTHNYDFYRTVWRRFGLGGANFHASKNQNKIHLEAETLYTDPFEKWKRNALSPDKSDMLIAMIPFVRNIAEYCGYEKEAVALTSLLHIKGDTDQFRVCDLGALFGKTLNGQDFSELENPNKLVIELIYEESDKISKAADVGADLEQKVVLSIGIRLKTEEFLISKLNEPEFVDGITKNQTATLIRRFKELFSETTEEAEFIRLMDRVNLMTPENIHLNSFMYEPILDMSADHLSKLYQEVSVLDAT